MAELGEMRQVALAAKQLSAQLFLELLDGPSKRRLRDVTFLGGAREIQQARHGQEVSDLVHLHAETNPSKPRQRTSLPPPRAVKP